MMKEIVEATLLSMWVAGWSTLLAVPLALICATLLFGSRWRRLEVFFLIPLFWSPSVSGFLILLGLSPNYGAGALLQDLGWRLIFTPWGTVLACLVVSFPLAFQSCIIGRARVPVDTQEISQVLGAPLGFRLLTVVWPQMTGAILVSVLLVIARTLGEFGASILVGGNIPGETQTLPLLIYSLTERRELGLAMIAALFSALLGLLAYLGLRRLEARHVRTAEAQAPSQ